MPPPLLTVGQRVCKFKDADDRLMPPPLRGGGITRSSSSRRDRTTLRVVKNLLSHNFVCTRSCTGTVSETFNVEKCRALEILSWVSFKVIGSD